MDNVILDKSFGFAVIIVKLSRMLREQNDFEFAHQIFKSGTSIGANIAEAQYGQSKKDFVAKMNIALKEAAETEYWLELLHETDYIDSTAFESIYKDCNELNKLLISIIKSANYKLQNTNHK